jgi:transcriptional regulator with XRE-family HTH domain
MMAGGACHWHPLCNDENLATQPTVKTVEHLFEETGLSLEELAQRSNLPLDRVEAIVVGCWTPSPRERERIAAAFGVSIEEISWGHTISPRNIRYYRFGLKEDF